MRATSYLQQLDVAATWEGDVAVVTLRGEADLSSVPFLTDYLAFVLDHGADHVVLDLARTELIDSTALAAIVPAARRAATNGGSVTLRSPSDVVRLILEVTPLGDDLAIEDAV